MEGNRPTFELRITPRLLVGLRNALLEAITDLIYANSAELEDLARDAFAYMTEVIQKPGSSPESRTGTLSIRTASADGNELVLAATRKLLGVLAKAVDYVQRSLLEFEVPIRLKLELVEVAALGRMLEEYATTE